MIYVADTLESFCPMYGKGIERKLIAGRRKKVEKASWDSKAEQVLEQLFGNKKSTHEEPVNV